MTPSDTHDLVAGGIVERYLLLGLRLGRHLDGLVDAYYGPPPWAREAEAGEPEPLPSLVAAAARLVADLDGGAGDGLEPPRRAWLRGQVVGLHTAARSLAGEDVPYLDEVEGSYGVRPSPVPEDALAGAHRRLDDALPGDGPVRDRIIAWRQRQLVPGEQLEGLVRDLADDLRERTIAAFGLPHGEQVESARGHRSPSQGVDHLPAAAR